MSCSSRRFEISTVKQKRNLITNSANERESLLDEVKFLSRRAGISLGRPLDVSTADSTAVPSQRLRRYGGRRSLPRDSEKFAFIRVIRDQVLAYLVDVSTGREGADPSLRSG